MAGREGRTGLSDDAYESALLVVRELLTEHRMITNSGLRSATRLNYDQAIKFFRRAVSAGVLERRGRSSGTHYVLVSQESG